MTHRRSMRRRRMSIVAVAASTGFAAATATFANEPAIETVEITGTRLDLAAQRAAVAQIPGGATLIDMADVAERNVSSLADALRYTPGVFAASSAGTDGMFFSSRGSNLDATNYDMNGIKLLQDGLPVTAADGSNHNRLIDPLSARYAVVARGANALTYGASTLGGAIAFTSPTALDGQRNEVLLNGGSFGQGYGRATLAQRFDDQFDGLLTVEGKTWDGYRDHSQQTRYGAYGNVGWQIGDGVEARLYGTYLHNNQELPGALTEEQVHQDPDQASAAARGGDYQLDVDTWRVATTTNWKIDADSRFFAGVSLEEQQLYHPIVDKVIVDPDGPTGPIVPFEVFSLLVDTNHRDVGGALGYEQRIGTHTLAFGATYGDNTIDGHDFRNDGGERNGATEIVDDHATNLEAYALDRWRIGERYTLTYGAQFVRAVRDAKTVEVASGAVSHPNVDLTTVNPRVGLEYALADGVTLYGNVSRLYEPPTNFELADDVRGGDHALDPMHGDVVEIGSRGRVTDGRGFAWTWEVDVYYARIDDEILSIDDPNAPGNSLSTNIDKTTHAGLEALVGVDIPIASRYVLAPLVSVSLNEFSFDGDAVYGSNQLPAAPDYVVRGEVMLRHSSGVYGGPTFDWVGERYADFANTYSVDAYGLLGLRTGWTSRNWHVYAEVRNLLDEHYIATTDVRDVAAADAAVLYPGESRCAFVGVQLTL